MVGGLLIINTGGIQSSYSPDFALLWIHTLHFKFNPLFVNTETSGLISVEMVCSYINKKKNVSTPFFNNKQIALKFCELYK